MKILHISLGLPPFRSGGLTKYCLDLMLTQIEQCNEVILLYPGQFHWGKTRIIKNQSYLGIQVFEIINPLPVPLLGGIRNPLGFMKVGRIEAFIRFLSDLAPNAIHVHTLMGIHKELLQAAHTLGIKIIFTTHDYFGICPKVNLIDANGAICQDVDQGNRCVSCNYGGYGRLALYLMQSRIYRKWKYSVAVSNIRSRLKKKNKVEPPIVPKLNAVAGIDTRLAKQYMNLRAYYIGMLRLVDHFHFNSTIAREVFSRYMQVNGQVIPITHLDVKDMRRKRTVSAPSHPLRIGYLGPLDIYKGFFLLKSCLDNLQANYKGQFQLHVFGNDLINTRDECNYVTYHGRYQYEQLEQIFEKIDVLVIPSLCEETFGFVGLEALSFGVPLLVSTNVGMRDLIRNGTGLLFDPKSEALISQLIHILENRELLTQMNHQICAVDIPMVMNQHALEMRRLYSKVLSTDEEEALGHETVIEKDHQISV